MSEAETNQCCGGAAPNESESCCARDAEAKAGGDAGCGCNCDCSAETERAG